MLQMERTLLRSAGTLLLLGTLLVTVPCYGQEPSQRRAVEQWQGEMNRFAKQDQDRLHEDVVFTGSSSVRMWNLEESFGDEFDWLNRGFGGSIINDNIQWMNQTVLPYTPRVVVLYAGDNDIGIGMSVDEVVGDYQKFCDKLHQELPEAKLVFIAIKPSRARWNLWPKMKAANDKIKALTEEADWQYFGDIAPPMLGEDGEPEAELFVDDGLHMTAEGYRRWKGVLQPLIEEALGKASAE